MLIAISSALVIHKLQHLLRRIHHVKKSDYSNHQPVTFKSGRL